MPKLHQQEKSVQIVVYVVRARRTKYVEGHEHRLSGHRHHHHHNYPPLRRSGGVDRRQQLLMYCREMRALACREQAPNKHKAEQRVHRPQLKAKEPPALIVTEEFLQITTTNKPQQKAPWMVIPKEEKRGPSHDKLPEPPTSCFSHFGKSLLPSFMTRTFGGTRAEKNKGRLRKKKQKNKTIVSIRDKMNAVLMSSRMKKERIGVMARFLSAFRKHP